MLCAGQGLVPGLGLWCVIFMVFGGIDSYAGYPLHHTESAWTVGEGPRKRDIAEHIMASTVDYDVGAMGAWQSMLMYELMPDHAPVSYTHLTLPTTPYV